MIEETESLSFAVLDQRMGIQLPPVPSEGEFPLPAWYRRIRKTPLAELSLEDLCRACRNQIHLAYVIPMALRVLRGDPLAGELVDGELVRSLSAVPHDYWKEHTEEAKAARAVLDVAQGSGAWDIGERADLALLRQHLLGQCWTGDTSD